MIKAAKRKVCGVGISEYPEPIEAIINKFPRNPLEGERC